MAVLTHAQIPAPAGPVRAPADQLDPRTLTDDQRALADQVLWELGIEDGHVTNGGGTPDITLRRALSAQAAAAINLNLPAGEELAQCALCRTILPAFRTHQCEDGLLRCTLPGPDDTSCYGLYTGSL